MIHCIALRHAILDLVRHENLNVYVFGNINIVIVMMNE